jgi:CRISPR-associated endonuclease/helicase Cas3
MKIGDFDRYFRALHGPHVDPFPWQRRLAGLVCEANEWPKVIDLPTGSGKTACIDIALFHLLVAASNGRACDAARRIAFVVDRRIIVDEAASRAQRISDAIQRAKDGILAEATELLSQLSDQKRVEVLTLRGGVPRETNLVRDPRTVAVVLSTVDQLGSRLLFRGYGVSDFAKPMHAGMFGFDTLLLLDEAHIAEPFRQTLAAIAREQTRTDPASLGVRPLRWSQLSATPASSPDFSINEADEAHPQLGRRLYAAKPMRLVEVLKRDELPKKILELVKSELSAPPQSDNEKPRIGIVVNRVATARAVQSALARAFGETTDVHLLIGRIRPIDRDHLMDMLTPELKSSEAPRAGDRPILVVATQTIEVGADFDFHTMFIEAASYPSIRQRVGRLNRLGLRKSARGAVILVRTDAENDPVYGRTIAATWTLLGQAASDGIVDLGIQRAPAATLSTVPESPPTPELSPSLLQLLVQTSPRPAIEPDVSNFLHGFSEQRADVSVVWRDGIYDDWAVDQVAATSIFDELPPLAIEAMSLPLTSFLSWLGGIGSKKPNKQADSGDLEGDVGPDDGADAPGVRVLVVNDRVELHEASAVKPGSMVVVASHWGGSDKYGFAPESTKYVDDLSLSARDLGQRATTLVFTPAIVRSWAAIRDPEQTELVSSARRIIRRIQEEDLSEQRVATVFFEWVFSSEPLLRVDVVALIGKLGTQRQVVEFLRDAASEIFGFVIRAQRPKWEDLTDDTVGLQRTVDVSLDDHCRGVADYADRFASSLGLVNAIREDLRLSGRLHDLGKADPRFQAMLGSDGSRLLAKGSSFERRVVLGARHECYSVAFVDQHPELVAAAHDPDLVRYLIGTHHGRGRSLHAVVEDLGASFELEFELKMFAFSGDTRLAYVDSGWPELFGRLQRRYGAWGLAYLETILRLADHRRSQAEVETEDANG